MDEALLLEIKQSINDLNEKLVFSRQEVFDAEEAARYLRIGYDTILRLARIGGIEYAKNGTNYLFKKIWLDNWLEDNKKA